jgi:hypothetical protein
MNNTPAISLVSFSDDSSATFLIRWRGRQEGPYTAAIIETRLAANQIGLLHEVFHNGQWVTLRDYFAERGATLRAQHEARAEQECRAREEAQRQVKEREDQHRAEALAEERRRNDLLEAGTETRRPAQQILKRPHRASTILTLAIVGLLVCGPLCIAAWIMGDSDLREMDAGLMDDNGRPSTATGRTLGIVGTVLWLIFAIVIFAH